MNLYNELKEILDGIDKDVHAFYDKGNKAAGTRVRNALQDLKAKSQDLRADILDTRKKNEGK